MKTNRIQRGGGRESNGINWLKLPGHGEGTRRRGFCEAKGKRKTFIIFGNEEEGGGGNREREGKDQVENLAKGEKITLDTRAVLGYTEEERSKGLHCFSIGWTQLLEISPIKDLGRCGGKGGEGCERRNEGRTDTRRRSRNSQGRAWRP